MVEANMSIICEEIFDEQTQPSEDEVRDYASKIGIDPDSEPHLLPLAAEALMKALPPGWRPCLDEKTNSYYYHNNLTGQTQWEHPLDDVYRTLVRKVRIESPSVSVAEHTEDATVLKDELFSFEDIPTKPAELLGARRKEILAPITFKGKSPKLSKQKSEETTATKPLHIFSSFDDAKDPPKIQELTLTGGGSMFLKSNTKKLSDASPVSAKNSSPSPDPPRSILRDRSLMEPSKSMEFEKSEKDDEDKKSVRFNLDNNTDAALTLSDGSSSEEGVNGEGDVINVKISKARFTIGGEEAVGVDDRRGLKVIKPNPCDFIKPVLMVESDSEDGSEMSEERIAKEKNEKKMERVKQQFWEEKNLELEKFKEDLNESHKKEMERILEDEKSSIESRIKLELDNLRKDLGNRLQLTLEQERQKFATELEEKKLELAKQFKAEKLRLEAEYELRLQHEKDQLEESNKKQLDTILNELEDSMQKRREDISSSFTSTLEQLKENHAIIMEELKRDFYAEEEALRKEHHVQMEDIKRTENEKHGDKSFEKLKNEKRLLDDKYRCLKEKYMKLKTEVKMSIAKRHRRKEQSGTTTTGSETERSHSINREKSPTHSSSTFRKSEKPPTPKIGRRKLENPATRQIIIQDVDTSPSDHSFGNDKNDSSDPEMNTGRSRKKLFSRLKSSSTSRINNNAHPQRQSIINSDRQSTSKAPRGKQQETSHRSCSPVENLRRQLQKLEDLEDQIPHSQQSDTYHLRYPFEAALPRSEGSSELEFFRHRIHLERDSIKRAKEGLKAQKSAFQQRQKDLKLRHGSMARHTLQQLCQEEKDLTDMEVSLHRTRSLLGEKVIRLRHLENSLQRASRQQADFSRLPDGEAGATLSDISSHSASSGISSTEFGDNYKITTGERFQESSEIIQSLECLNSEIKEIWEVLYKQQQHSPALLPLPPPPYPILCTAALDTWPPHMLAGGVPPSIPTLADRLQNYRQQVALANAQSTVVTHAANNNQGATTTLVERTRNLRHWLRQASGSFDGIQSGGGGGGGVGGTGDGNGAHQANL